MQTPEELVYRLYKRIEETGALLRDGEFTLSSGARSSYYFDGKRLALDQEAIGIIGRLIFRLLEDSDVSAVGGLSMGADFIVAKVLDESFVADRRLLGFIVRKTPKEHGTKKYIEGHLPTSDERAVAIVDDVITEGASVRMAIASVLDEGCQVSKIITILDRQEGGSEKLIAEGYDFATVFTATKDGEIRVAYPGLPPVKASELGAVFRMS